jgi:hypothetical protein
MSWQEQVNFQWDDDKVRFVLDQQIGELSESFSKYFRFLACKLYVPPHSGLESAISITFIYLFIYHQRQVCLLNAFQMIYVLNIGTITFSNFFQLCHGKNKLIFSEMMIRSALY